MLTGLQLTPAQAHQALWLKMSFVHARLQVPVCGWVKKVDWCPERDEWKREKARPGGEEVMVQSW